MHALLRRVTDRAGELTDEYSQKASQLTEQLTERARERAERVREQAGRLYSQAQDHPRAMATALAIIAAGVVAAGVWGFLRYRERRLATSRRSSGAAQGTRRKRVKAGRAATAS